MNKLPLVATESARSILYTSAISGELQNSMNDHTFNTVISLIVIQW